jgi:hypothetical protein
MPNSERRFPAGAIILLLVLVFFYFNTSSQQETDPGESEHEAALARYEKEYEPSNCALAYDDDGKLRNPNPRIQEMEVGDICWTVMWAKRVGEDGSEGLDPNYSLSPNVGGTVAMQIKRCENGFVVLGVSGWNAYEETLYEWEPMPIPPNFISVVSTCQR